MLYILSFHIIALIAWFAGLFYLPRLFVYHAEAEDSISNERFKIMERRLYRGIMIPAMIATIVFGFWLFFLNPNYYLKEVWMHVKLFLVFILVGYHHLCGYYIKLFSQDKNKKSSLYFRCFNEVPTVILILIILLAEVKPF